MLNQAPIFINAFSRGGSNIFWNLLLSHPDVCSPIRETLEIFKVGRRGTRAGYRAALLSRQLSLFGQKNLKPRRPISREAQLFIDRTLYEWKLKTCADEEMRYRSEGERYQLEEVKSARLAAKNNNGLAFLSDILTTMYPDVTFFGLVRHPLPLYESHRRRRFVKSLDEFIGLYHAIAGKMLEDAERYDNYHIVRFEDVLGDVRGSVNKIYGLAGLDVTRVPKLRFKAKRHYHADGTRDSAYNVGQHYWFSFDEVEAFLDSGVNQYHIEQLSERDKTHILERTQSLRDVLGYTS